MMRDPIKAREAIARRALKRRVDKMFTELELERIEWGPDHADERTYTWFAKLDGEKTEFVYGYKSKTVTACGVRV